jgi:thioredoxin reductase (NADPH)
MSGEFDVAVIGGGLAGLSAALTSARLGWRTAILTGGVIGGQLVSIDKIEGAPGFPEGVAGYDLCPMTQEQADAAGVQFVMASCDSLARDGEGWRLKSAEGDITARGVVIATGTSLAKIGVPGEDRLVGRGVSHCASCDAPLLRGKLAVVAGGGDSAMQEALTLADHVAKVIILQRGDELTGQASYRTQVEDNPKIEIRYGVEVTSILGEDGVTHVRVKDLASGEETDLETAAVFPCVGLVPDAGLAEGLAELDSTGRIRVDAALRTEAKGLCAAGNVRQGSPHRAAGAMGDGATAAAALGRYLATGEWRD